MTAIDNLSDVLAEDAFPGEVVTRAIVRDVDLGAVGVLALITLDNGHDHTKPSTFGPQGLLSLNAALDAVAARAAAARSPPSASPASRSSSRPGPTWTARAGDHRPRHRPGGGARAGGGHRGARPRGLPASGRAAGAVVLLHQRGRARRRARGRAALRLPDDLVRVPMVAFPSASSAWSPRHRCSQFGCSRYPHDAAGTTKSAATRADATTVRSSSRLLAGLEHCSLPGSPVAPTSRSSSNASATAACAPPKSTSTPSPTPTKPPSTPSPRCGTEHLLCDLQR